MSNVIKPFKIEIRERFKVNENESSQIAYIAETMLRKLLTVDVKVEKLSSAFGNNEWYYEVKISFPEIDKYYTLAIADKLNNEIENYVNDKLKNYKIVTEIREEPK